MKRYTDRIQVPVTADTKGLIGRVLKPNEGMQDFMRDTIRRAVRSRARHLPEIKDQVHNM